MVIYLIIGSIFGSCAAFVQWRRFRPLFVELLITFLANGLLFPLIMGLVVARALKGDKVVIIPKL